MEKRGDEKKSGAGRVILPFAIRKGFVYYVDEQGNLREVKAQKGVGDKIKKEEITGKKVTGFEAGPAASGVKFAESGLKRYRNIYLTICMASLIVAIFALFKDDYFVLTLSAVGLALALIFFSIVNNKIEKVRVLSGKKVKEKRLERRTAKGLPAFIPIVFFIAAVACAVYYFINEDPLYLILSGAIFVVFIIFFVIYLTVTKKRKPKKKSFKDLAWNKRYKRQKKEKGKEERRIIAQKSLVLASKMKEDRTKQEKRKAIHAAKPNIQLIFFFMALALGVLGTISFFNRDFISMAVTGVVLVLAVIVYLNFIKKRKKEKPKKEGKKPEKKKEEKKEEKKIVAKKPEFKAKRKEKKVKRLRGPEEKRLRAPMIIAIIFFLLALALGVFAYLREDTLSLIIAGATLLVSFSFYIFFMTRLKMKKVATKKARLHRIVRKATKQRRIIARAGQPLPKREFMDSIREQQKLVTKSRIVPIFFLIIALGLGTLAFLKKESLSLIMAVAALCVIFVLLFAASRVDKKLKKQRMKIAIRQLRREKRGMETDIDLLLGLLERFKKIKIKEVSYAFDIYEDKAEEWAKILEEGGFATMYYPAFGGVELRWKKK